MESSFDIFSSALTVVVTMNRPSAGFLGRHPQRHISCTCSVTGYSERDRRRPDHSRPNLMLACFQTDNIRTPRSHLPKLAGLIVVIPEGTKHARTTQQHLLPIVIFLTNPR